MKFIKLLSTTLFMLSTTSLPLTMAHATTSTAVPVVAKSTTSSKQTQKMYGVPGPRLVRVNSSSNSYTYQVRSKVYRTLSRESGKHYSEVGIASYYGGKFNGRKTSSGEIFNENLYTAAHKTLPIPSYAVVTNLRNGRQVIVRINDRGPFVGSRKIDLSRGAAKQLGMMHHGTAKVKIEAIRIDPNGNIIGKGSSTLLALAKKQHVSFGNDSSSNIAIAKNSVERNSSKSINVKPVENIVVAKASSTNKSKVSIVAEAKNNVSESKQYELHTLNLDNESQANALINKLNSTHNVTAKVLRQGENVSIKFGPIDSRKIADRLKNELIKNGQYSNVLYSFNK